MAETGKRERSPKLRMNRDILRKLERALEATRGLHTLALTDPCRRSVEPFVKEWIEGYLDRAIKEIKGEEEVQPV